MAESSGLSLNRDADKPAPQGATSATLSASTPSSDHREGFLDGIGATNAIALKIKTPSWTDKLSFAEKLTVKGTLTSDDGNVRIVIAGSSYNSDNKFPINSPDLIIVSYFPHVENRLLDDYSKTA